MKTKSKIMQFCAKTAYSISPRLYIILSYFHNRGKLPKLKHPQDLSEIIYNQILSGEINKYAPYVDKIKARDFITEWGYGTYLPKIYGVWKNFDDIDFNTLPNKFALKTNHGCGSHYICRDKNNLDILKAKRLINTALNTKFGLTETQYHYITPQIYCEEYIEDKHLELPLDYKFMCCDGEVRCILICSERTTGTRLSTYSKEWEELDLLRDYEKSHSYFEKPKNFDKMIEIASNIAKEFVQVRVDMYNIDGRIIIGELTFTPEGGIMKYYTNKALVFLGHKTDLKND